ncbi:hypothetical protein [Herbaspirillum sp. alder98]|nr:hypothetical protein [Herbaspirillum sp. alder98]MCA1324777.1 hypothetical protein [Herbaspirillum sp. alder98]
MRGDGYQQVSAAAFLISSETLGNVATDRLGLDGNLLFGRRNVSESKA